MCLNGGMTKTTKTCNRCSSPVVLARSRQYVTSNQEGTWILPSHLNNTCDGIHLHQVEGGN